MLKLNVVMASGTLIRGQRLLTMRMMTIEALLIGVGHHGRVRTLLLSMTGQAIRRIPKLVENPKIVRGVRTCDIVECKLMARDAFLRFRMFCMIGRELMAGSTLAGAGAGELTVLGGVAFHAFELRAQVCLMSRRGSCRFPCGTDVDGRWSIDLGNAGDQRGDADRREERPSGRSMLSDLAHSPQACPFDL